MESCRQILTEGLDFLRLSINEKAVDDLLAFSELIGKWNKVYNLTAIKQPLDRVRLHLLDSLSVHDLLNGTKILDIGTGAGLPGIPLAIANPDKCFVLVDSNSKKTRFVQQAILELGLTNVSVQHSRIEQFKPEQRFDSIISRAFSSTENFIEVSTHLLSDNGMFLAMKGCPPTQEFESLKWAYRVYPLKVPGVDAERCLVKIFDKS